MKVGLQVYSVRDFAEKDLKGTLKKIKEMGYDGVEFGGLYELSYAEVGAMLREVGIKAISAHVPYALLVNDTDAAIEGYKSLGCEYIAVPYMNDDDRPGRPGFGKVIENIRMIGFACKKHGVQLLYHNHDFEFVRVEDGEYGLDYLYSHVDADILKTELDTCWVKVAGENPAAYIGKYSGRCPLVHLKDFVGSKSENMYELIGIEGKKAEVTKKFAFRPVGYGIQDFKAITKAASDGGASWIIVEQDSSDDCPSLEAAEMSRKYLRTIGY